MAQLDETLDDTVSVKNLVIDESMTASQNKAPVTDTRQDDPVLSVINDLVDNVVSEVDGDELSITPPCSQMPHEDPYARRCEVKDDSEDIR